MMQLHCVSKLDSELAPQRCVAPTSMGGINKGARREAAVAMVVLSFTASTSSVLLFAEIMRRMRLRAGS